jgi:hypothetical protein
MNDFFQRMNELQNRLNPALSLYDQLSRMHSAFTLPKGVIDIVKAQQIWSDRLNKSVVPYVGGLNSISKMLSHETFLQQAGTIQMCNALQISSYASLALIQNDKFGIAINLSKTFNHSLFNNLKSLSKSYNHLLETSEKLQPQFAVNQKLFESFPALSFYKAASFARSISDVEEIDLEIEDTDVTEIITESYPEDINQYLSDIGEDILKLWVEARSALLGDYLGNERHCFLCLRELFTNILHRIAPDEEVMQWSTNAKHIENGKVTRAARLEYVYSSMNFPPFDEFLKADIPYTLKIVSSLQRVHEAKLSLTPLQKRIIFEKFEVSLKMMIEARRNKK